MEEKKISQPRANTNDFTTETITNYQQALRPSFILSLFTKVYFIFFHFIIIMKSYLFLEHFCVLPDLRFLNEEK